MKTLFKKTMVLAGFLALAATPNTKAQQQGIDTGKLNRYLEIQRQQLGFSGTVMVSRGGKVLFNANIGNASVELGVLISKKTVFPVASISKSFTAMLTLIAVNEGKLVLSDSLPKFFPQLSGSPWSAITIDQLLSHRSGIPHNEGIPGYWAEKSTISYKRVPAMKEIFSLKLESTPGTTSKYSSPGYFVLASILENLYGKSYGALVAEKICRPLALEHTGQLNNRTIVPGLASGYQQIAGDLTVAPYRSYSLMKGSGDLYTSATDLISFLDSFGNQKWPVKLEKEMFAQHSSTAVERGDLYGYGWFIRTATAQQPLAYYHGGGSFGVSALMARYPNNDLSIVMLSNISALPVNQLWSDIEKIVLGNEFQLPAIKTSQPISSATLRSLIGNYSTPTGQQMEITTQNGRLYAKLAGKSPFEIFQQSPLNFFGKIVPVELIFVNGDGGLSKSITVSGMGQVFTFARR